MIYGIDLGTTNSLIGYGDQLITGLVSSSVDLATKEQVPRGYVTDTVESSYKANMTTGTSGQIPMLASSIILRTLADKVYEKTGKVCQDVVVSVPAKFSNTQREAVKKSVEMANLNLKGLVNEPTAAALYVCKERKGRVLVFDLGGGTFDVTLLDSRFGTYMVEATEGLILAGDDFDKALLDYALSKIKLPIRFRTPLNMKRLQNGMRLVKESIQRSNAPALYSLPTDIGFKGEVEITPEIYCQIMMKVFEPTVKLAQRILSTYTYMSEEDAPSLVFVGGSTICPFLRAWVSKELGLPQFASADDADFTVARGVSIYAKMLEDGEIETQVDDVTSRISIEDSNGWAIQVIDKNTVIPYSASITVCNDKRSDVLELNLYSGDDTLCSRNEYLGTLTYKYPQVMEPGEGYVDVAVNVDRNGLISIIGTDLLTQEQQQIKLERGVRLC